MPVYQLAYTQLIAAGATFNPLATWDYETPKGPAQIEVIERATAVGLVGAIKTGGENIKQESNIQAGGTAGVTPSPLNTTPTLGKAMGGLKLSIPYRNPTGGGITVDGVITMIVGGGRRGR